VLAPQLLTSMQILAGGDIKQGAKLLLDYDYQPGPMGHHDYDLWAGLSDHLPWPPNTTTTTTAHYRRRTDLQQLGATVAVGLGDAHSNLGEGKGSGSFMEPLYVPTVRTLYTLYTPAPHATRHCNAIRRCTPHLRLLARSARTHTRTHARWHRYYSGHKEKLEALIDVFQQRGDPLVGIHLNHDEINGIARDRRSMLSNLTNGQLLMQSINRLTSIITAKQPGITPFVYDDMFNPWQLYVGDQDNMQAEWYGREDYTLETAIEYLDDKTTVLLPWFYSWPADTVSVTGSLHGASVPASSVKGHSHPAFTFKGEWPLGFRTVGCPFDDDNMTQYWANELGKDKKLGLGFMDTDWSKTGNGLPYTGFVGWNNANHTLPVTWQKWGKRTNSTVGGG